MKGWKNPKPPQKHDWWARALAVIALIVSGLSFLFSYESGLPSLAAKVQFANPIVAGQHFNIKMDLDNNGNTTARHMRPEFQFGWASSGADFQPFKGPLINAVPANWKPTVSDLGPKGHTTFVSENTMAFADDATVQGVLAGTYKFYFYGKIPYDDVLHLGHEFHFCFYYVQAPGLDPERFVMCPTYNETQ